jgi:hypothetical protein
MPSLLQQMFRRKPVLEMEAESGSETDSHPPCGGSGQVGAPPCLRG